MITASVLARAPHTGLGITVFAVFVVSVLLISLLDASQSDTPRRFFVSGGRLSCARNGIALFGDFISAATLLGTPGLIALAGFDGIPCLVGPIVAWAVILLLVAEPFHNTGRYTVGDVLAHHLRPRPVHMALGVATLVISLFYLASGGTTRLGGGGQDVRAG
ncbi:sodium:solute symporter family transporter [Streptomyces sp. NBC_00996]|uniref:sodium:solute symporter family transporter n=1 Tax=Streptomyces sp. NBC_00996 TaxID=2903710 RepID=UPI00386843F2|nr:hypothetical protein OG390_49290 [Streptomyces sp. NBC_00996]